MSTERDIPKATSTDAATAAERNSQRPTGPHCENCGSKVPRKVARVMGTDGTTPVCKHCVAKRSGDGNDVNTTTRAVWRYRRRQAGGTW
ncbi:hypothetical protein DVK02_14845 [Halobellus sp. Atlit-31R]|nr:hypothetical protein DVK02_14845 [Halobellus sp. Atlit-31R]